MAVVPNNTETPTFMGMNSAQIGQLSMVGQVAGMLNSGLRFPAVNDLYDAGWPTDGLIPHGIGSAWRASRCR